VRHRTNCPGCCPVFVRTVRTGQRTPPKGGMSVRLSGCPASDRLLKAVCSRRSETATAQEPRERGGDADEKRDPDVAANEETESDTEERLMLLRLNEFALRLVSPDNRPLVVARLAEPAKLHDWTADEGHRVDVVARAALRTLCGDGQPDWRVRHRRRSFRTLECECTEPTPVRHRQSLTSKRACCFG
jgi:hypothetical protein